MTTTETIDLLLGEAGTAAEACGVTGIPALFGPRRCGVAPTTEAAQRWQAALDDYAAFEAEIKLRWTHDAR
ncbi:MAG TPA: hypothetical protein DCQ64_33370 [Candidatus Rokubacteria bacterium]|nr:hypothetical protein [Candidatus Rokubacteria bacterium]